MPTKSLYPTKFNGVDQQVKTVRRLIDNTVDWDWLFLDMDDFDSVMHQLKGTFREQIQAIKRINATYIEVEQYAADARAIAKKLLREQSTWMPSILRSDRERVELLLRHDFVSYMLDGIAMVRQVLDDEPTNSIPSGPPTKLTGDARPSWLPPEDEAIVAPSFSEPRPRPKSRKQRRKDAAAARRAAAQVAY